jgi:hypothetical protein
MVSGSTRWSLISLATPLIAAICASSCSGGDHGGPPAPPPAAYGGSRALHIQVGSEKRTVDFVPDIDHTASHAAIQAGVSKPQSLGGVLAGVPASALLYGVADSIIADAAHSDGTTNLLHASDLGLPFDHDASAAPPPWSGTGDTQEWFVFAGIPTTCPDLLRYEQVLILMADKLRELADTVNIVQWQIPPSCTNNACIPLFHDLPGPWQILPQSDLNRFVARDLAIYTLASLAQTDQIQVYFPGAPGTGYMTCPAAYKLAADSEFGISAANLLWDQNIDGDLGLTTFDWMQAVPPSSAIVEERLSLFAHTLRASARMVHDLVHDSVYADLAGAADRAGQASDPLRANSEIWGDEDPYDSLAHAMRVVAGRWDTYGDPSALQLLSKIGYNTTNPWTPDPEFAEKTVRKNDAGQRRNVDPTCGHRNEHHRGIAGRR